ncbi:MAG: homoserine kinase [Firmicutes bacterium]|nr:homoserine kinase [Bacillota bacterium]
MWHIKVPASTANLGSGFDALGMALSLPLECWFSLAEDPLIEVRGEGSGSIPETTDNLVWRTADFLHRDVTGQAFPSGHLTIRSRIPLARGLGSSAAAIVAGLMLANTLLPERLPRDTLLDYATRLEGHPDNVAAALYGGFVFAWEEAGRVRIKSYPAPELRCILVIPDYKVSTEEARRVLPERVPLADAVFNAQRLALWIDALHRRDWSLLKEAGKDRLHQPYRQPLVPGMQALIDTALSHGAAFAGLSGSGPTILALVASEQADAVLNALTRAASEVVPAPSQLIDVTPSYFGAEAVLEGWQWRAGEPMGFNTRSHQTVNNRTFN